MDPEHEADLGFLAEIAAMPSDLLARVYRPWQLTAAEKLAETERGAALGAVLDQLAKVELAIERLHTLRAPAAPDIAARDADDRPTS